MLKIFKLFNKTYLRLLLLKPIYKKVDKFICKNKKEEYLVKVGKIKLGYKMNLKNPRTFNEYLNFYKLHYYNPLMELCVDKIKVDKYVSEKGLENILIKKYKTWNSPDEVDLDVLPDKFVLKCNHFSGKVMVCKNNGEIDNFKLKKVLDSYKINLSKKFLEWPYENVERKIFAEELVLNKDGSALIDYKFYCFNGEPKFIHVASEKDVSTKYDYFTTDWEWINVKQDCPNAKNHPLKPANLEEMINVARILSADFPHVRVDLYNIDGKIKFSELTFFDGGGMERFIPRKYDYIFGEYFKDVF